MSETGTYSPDWLSLQPDWLKGDDLRDWEDEGSGFRRKLGALLKAGDVDSKEVSIEEVGMGWEICGIGNWGYCM